jgi:dienelactone hydrolase
MTLSNPKFQSPKPKWIGFGLGCGLWVLGLVAEGDAAGRAVSFRTADGRAMTGLMFDAGERPAPAIVLVPMLGRPKDDWQAVAERLAEANIGALAMDLPGTALPADAQELQRWHEPIGAAVAYLAGRPAEVQAGAIGVAGASLGANLTVLAAAADPAIRSIALISPSLDYRDVRIELPFTQYGARPALLMASVHDPYAARSIRILAQEASGVREVRWSSIPAHGTLLLARDAELVRQLVEWFQRTLSVN